MDASEVDEQLGRAPHGETSLTLKAADSRDTLAPPPGWSLAGVRPGRASSGKSLRPDSRAEWEWAPAR
jgi:hypothetical protein